MSTHAERAGPNASRAPASRRPAAREDAQSMSASPTATCAFDVKLQQRRARTPTRGKAAEPSGALAHASEPRQPRDVLEAARRCGTGFGYRGARIPRVWSRHATRGANGGQRAKRGSPLASREGLCEARLWALVVATGPKAGLSASGSASSAAGERKPLGTAEKQVASARTRVPEHNLYSRLSLIATAKAAFKRDLQKFKRELSTGTWTLAATL